MINKEFFKLAEEDAVARGFELDEVLGCMERALIGAFKKEHGNTSCRVEFKKDRNEIILYSVHKVVEEYTVYDEENPAPETEEPVYAEMLLADAKKIKQSYKVGDLVTQVENLKNYSRLTILSASNVYKQGIRTLEREKAYVYFKALENEMITAEVANIGERFLTLSLGSLVVCSTFLTYTLM